MVSPLFIISVLPVFLIGLYIYKKDKEKEPSKLLAKLFLGGMLSCFLVLIVSNITDRLIPLFASDPNTLNMIELVLYVFIGVALIEEGCKWIMVYTISYKDKNFDELYDAILYCMFVALGFACFENLLYVYQGGFATGILRAFLAVPGHACDGMFMGYFLGKAKHSALHNKTADRNKYIFLSILVPTLMHGFYDYCIFTQNLLFIGFFFIFVICMYIISIKQIKKVSSINRKMKYKDNYCPNCGTVVDSNYCPKCGRKND